VFRFIKPRFLPLLCVVLHEFNRVIPMPTPRYLHLLFSISFFLSSVGAAGGQSFSVTASASSPYLSSCNNSSGTKQTVTCSDSWEYFDQGGNLIWEGVAAAIAEGGYGPFRLAGYSKLTFFSNAGASDDGAASADSYDFLSVLGLPAGTVAYLYLQAQCSACAKLVSVLYGGDYYLFAWPPGDNNPISCLVGPSMPATCTLKIAIAYNGGSTIPIEIYREVAINAVTSTPDGPPGSTISTAISIGYQDAGPGAELNVSVRNATGQVIEGAEVVGASGHIYN
jgi:hypothetical protein